MGQDTDNTKTGNNAPDNDNPQAKQDSWYGKYIEKIIAAVISVFLIGIVSWAFGHFATKIENIEKNIAAHHGPQWEKLEKVVAVGNLRSEFLQAKQEYANKLTALELALKNKDKELSKAIRANSLLTSAFKEWARQADKVVSASREREFEAYAHLTTHAPDNADVALLNTAHVGGTRFNTGDQVIITNTSSGRREKAAVKIVSAYTDIENTDVLVQIAEQPAEILGLSKSLGRIKVIVKKEKPERDDPNRWIPIAEVIEHESLISNLPAPAAGE